MSFVKIQVTGKRKFAIIEKSSEMRVVWKEEYQ